jgi:hypothetical protein
MSDLMGRKLLPATPQVPYSLADVPILTGGGKPP